MIWTSQNGQTPIDLAVQLYGSAELVLQLMQDNGLTELTASVPTGTQVVYSELAAGHPARELQQFVWAKGIVVNTSVATAGIVSGRAFSSAFSVAFG